jgi:hypothetical protein
VVPIFNRHYIPEAIIAYIPIYQAQLNEKLALVEGDAELTIRDNSARDPQLVCQTIRFVASGYLTPRSEADKTNDHGAWDNLVKLYNFSTLMSIETLQVAMLTKFCNLIESLDPAKFQGFARRYYDRKTHNLYFTSTLGSLIKVKLAEFLPRLQQTMTIQEISSLGGYLGTQLVEVLLEDRIVKPSALGELEVVSLSDLDG